MRRRALLGLALGLACGALAVRAQQPEPEPEPGVYEFTEADKAFLSRFSLARVPELPAAPSNAVADDLAAARLGRDLFYDARLSATGSVSCASCHQPQRYFTDGLARSRAIGITRRSAPSLLVASHGPWQFWDGRKDSLWSQALSPLEDPAEHALSRLQVAQHVGAHYRRAYRRVFGGGTDWDAIAAYSAPASPLGGAVAKAQWQAIAEPGRAAINRVFSNVGKAIMAYIRRLSLSPARFDRFLEALARPETTPAQLAEWMSEAEVRGMRLFMGKAGCASCHNGPLFTNHEFHNVGAPEPDESSVDLGRYAAIEQLLADEFTCLSAWSDAKPAECEEIRYLKRSGPELVGAYKTPSLRNVAETAPYMQSGQLGTLRAVIEHYNRPLPPFFDPVQHPNRPHFDVLPLELSEQEKHELIVFLGTLTSPLPSGDPWWPLKAPEEPPAISAVGR